MPSIDRAVRVIAAKAEVDRTFSEWLKATAYDEGSAETYAAFSDATRSLVGLLVADDLASDIAAHDAMILEDLTRPKD